MNTLEFEIHNQKLIRVDSQEVINKNKNVYKCTFTFEEDSEWVDLNKFVIFTDGWGNSITQHLGNNSNILSCLVPDRMLKGSYFKISVYASDLITTNNVSIALMESGYNRDNHNPNCHKDKDIFVEIFDRLDNLVDSIFYDNNTLHLFNRDVLLESIYLPFLEKKDIVSLVNDLTNEFILNVPVASDGNDGLMSSTDKRKLDSIEDMANHTIVDNSFSNSSDNPVSNRVIDARFNNVEDMVNNRLDGFDDDIDEIRVTLNGKEDVYDYVERLDNIIVTLINKGE